MIAFEVVYSSIQTIILARPENINIDIPKRVYEETVIESKGYPDAEKIQENIDAVNIHISGSSRQEKGEVESLRLYRLGGFELIASDDRKFLLKAHISNDQYLTAISEVLRWER